MRETAIARAKRHKRETDAARALFPHCKRCGVELNAAKRATHDGDTFTGWLCYPCWKP